MCVKAGRRGSLGGSAVWHLPLAQGAVLEAQDRVPRQAPGMEPASPSSCVSYEKIKKKKRKRNPC